MPLTNVDAYYDSQANTMFCFFNGETNLFLSQDSFNSMLSDAQRVLGFTATWNEKGPLGN